MNSKRVINLEESKVLDSRNCPNREVFEPRDEAVEPNGEVKSPAIFKLS